MHTAPREGLAPRTATGPQNGHFPLVQDEDIGRYWSAAGSMSPSEATPGTFPWTDRTREVSFLLAGNKPCRAACVLCLAGRGCPDPCQWQAQVEPRYFVDAAAAGRTAERETLYKAIVNPMDIQTSSAVFWTCLKAVTIWIISVLLAIPDAVFSDLVPVKNNNVNFTACIPYPYSNEMHPKIHSILIFMVYFLIPLTIISVYYYHIAKTLIKSAHDMPGEFSEHSKRQMETRKRLAKIVLVFVGLFALCWFPNHVLYMYRNFNYKEIDTSAAHFVITLLARMLSFSNSCVNPFALYLLSESFRRHFNSHLCCRRKRHRERSMSYAQSTSAVRMTSLKSNMKNTSSTLLNGNSLRHEVSL
uniref:Neuromedin B receptor n=1 Tax=Erpetoichthys calabaricus TaxID=27687 RepID=A0A8C4SPD7_ERPCA